jgi:hypothetical protein
VLEWRQYRQVLGLSQSSLVDGVTAVLEMDAGCPGQCRGG